MNEPCITFLRFQELTN